MVKVLKSSSFSKKVVNVAICKVYNVKHSIFLDISTSLQPYDDDIVGMAVGTLTKL